jgi:hypothetical protein
VYKNGIVVVLNQGEMFDSTYVYRRTLAECITLFRNIFGNVTLIQRGEFYTFLSKGSVLVGYFIADEIEEDALDVFVLSYWFATEAKKHPIRLIEGKESIKGFPHLDWLLNDWIRE